MDQKTCSGFFQFFCQFAVSCSGFVQKEVETSTAKLILGGQVSEGDTILLDVENGGLKAMIKPGVEVVDE